MKNRFDQWLEKLISRDPQRRMRKVLTSAWLLLFFSLLAVGGATLYPVELRVPAVARVEKSAQGPLLSITLAAQFFDRIQVGQIVRFKKYPALHTTLQGIGELSEQGTFLAWAPISNEAAHNLKTGTATPLAVAIIFRRASLVEILLRP